MDLQEIVFPGTSLELAHSLDERRTLDITNGTTQLPN